MPGQNYQGSKYFPEPVVLGNTANFTKGLATGGLGASPPVVTTPSTVPSAGTVTNTTGYDVVVYAAATGGISAAVVAGGTVPGVVANSASADYYLAAASAITLTYGGTLTWKWLAV